MCDSYTSDNERSWNSLVPFQRNIPCQSSVTDCCSERLMSSHFDSHRWKPCSEDWSRDIYHDNSSLNIQTEPTVLDWNSFWWIYDRSRLCGHRFNDRSVTKSSFASCNLRISQCVPSHSYDCEPAQLYKPSDSFLQTQSIKRLQQWSVGCRVWTDKSCTVTNGLPSQEVRRHRRNEWAVIQSYRALC